MIYIYIYIEYIYIIIIIICQTSSRPKISRPRKLPKQPSPKHPQRWGSSRPTRKCARRSHGSRRGSWKAWAYGWLGVTIPGPTMAQLEILDDIWWHMMTWKIFLPDGWEMLRTTVISAWLWLLITIIWGYDLGIFSIKHGDVSTINFKGLSYFQTNPHLAV